VNRLAPAATDALVAMPEGGRDRDDARDRQRRRRAVVLQAPEFFERRQRRCRPRPASSAVARERA
jgi:hypothetical protein